MRAESGNLFTAGSEAVFAGAYEGGDSLREYWQQINRINVPLLRAEQEVELAMQMEAGQIAEAVLAARGVAVQQIALTNVSAKPAATRLWTEGRTLADYEAADRLLDDRRISDAELRRVGIEGRRAFKTFVEANLRLVVFLATVRYRYVELPVMDAIQEGNIGLVRAVQKFDYRLGYKFSTYAAHWIRRFIK